MTFFIPSDAFLGVVKLYVFIRKKILDTLGDALSSELFGQFVLALGFLHLPFFSSSV